MELSVFEYDNYRTFLKKVLQERKSERGLQGKLADAANCQRSYLSRVLNDTAELTMEQAILIAKFLDLPLLSEKYFLGMVGVARSGNKTLRQYWLSQMSESKSKNENFANKFTPSPMSQVEHTAYFSSWHWSAIHAMTGVESLRTPEAISSRLVISLDKTLQILTELQKMNLVEEIDGHWHPKINDMHLNKNDAMTSANHNNWRIKALNQPLKATPEEIKYTSVFSLSVQDLAKIRLMIMSVVESFRPILRESDEEEVACLTIDLFRI